MAAPFYESVKFAYSNIRAIMESLRKSSSASCNHYDLMRFRIRDRSEGSEFARGIQRFPHRVPQIPYEEAGDTGIYISAGLLMPRH
jgi:hypothetical protein